MNTSYKYSSPPKPTHLASLRLLLSYNLYIYLDSNNSYFNMQIRSDIY